MSLEFSLAIHEAGHAVIAAMLGFSLRSTQIVYTRDGGMAGLHSYGIPSISMSDRRWGVLKISIAGHMAEQLWGFSDTPDFTDWFMRPRPCQYRNSWVHLTDQALAWQQSKELAASAELFDENTYRGFIELVEPEIRAKLTSPAPWASLLMIANRLCEVGEVSQQEHYTIFEQANFDTRHALPN